MTQGSGMSVRTSRARWAVRAGVALAIAAGGVGVVVLAGAGEEPRQAARSGTPTSTDMGVAKRQGFDVTTTANGDLQAKNQIELRSKLDRESTIQFIIAEGTRVTKAFIASVTTG